MADTTALKNRIRAAIKSNDNQEITGPVLQQALLDMVDELNGATETEASQRQSGDSTLQQGINTERQARIDADNALGQRITEEAQRAQEAEQILDGKASKALHDIENLEIEDVTGSQAQANELSIALRTNEGSAEDPEIVTLDTLVIPQASAQKAGLMSSAMRDKLLTALPNDIASVKDNYFDLTPDGNGYWSAAGVVTELASYRYKSIDVSSLGGKLILVKAGYPAHNNDYSYIKKSNDSYVSLASCAIANNIVPSGCSVIQLPNDAVRLDISWDYNSGVRAIVSYDYLLDYRYQSIINNVDNIPTFNSTKFLSSGGAFNSIEPLKDRYFDVTPDGINHYWSVGGTLSEFKGYRYKSINISAVAGKQLCIRAGYRDDGGNYILSYCFVKKSDDTYVALNTLIVGGIVYPSKCRNVILPDDAVQLDISWDANQGWSPIISVVETPVLTNRQITDINNNLTKINSKIGGFWDLSDCQVGYWSAGGVFTELQSYRGKAFSLIGKQGQIIIINGGGQTSIDWCWIKYSDDSYKKLESIREITMVNGFAILKINADMVELEYCYDIYAIRERGSAFVGIFMSPEPYHEKMVYEVLPCNETQINLKTFTKDVTSNYIDEQYVEVGYYDYKGVLHSSDTNWRHIEINIVAGTRLRFKFYSYSTVAPFILKDTNGIIKKVYANIAAPNIGEISDYLLYAEGNCKLTWTYSVQSGHSHYIYEAEKSSIEKDVDNLKQTIFTSAIQLIYYSNPDYSGKYWDANGTLRTLNSYCAFEIDVSSYIGKRIKVRAGYDINTAAGITGWCWIKKTDNSIVALVNLVQSFVSGQYAIVNVPENADKLLISTDRATYTSNNWDDPYCEYDELSEFQIVVNKVDEIDNRVTSLEANSLPLAGKKIFLFGDSISSTDYTWYRDYLALYTGATVYNQGASGRNAAYQASNEYFQRLANLPSDVIVVLCGGNDSGASGTIGTFDSNSELGQMGESVVQETDISIDYNGTTFIQAISHIIRKWRNLYWNFRLAAGLNANILDTQNDNEVVYPLSGTATESQCISYAQSQGWTLGYGERYVMKTTETNADKRVKLIAVKQPKMFLCTTLPQRRYNSSSYWSNPQNWERKRLACIECAEKYGIPLIDLAKEFAIDWDAEPYWPGQGYSGTSKTDNQGIYTMDGLHPNEFGYAYISQIVSKRIIGDVNV